MKAQNLFATEEEEANSPKVEKSKIPRVKSSSARLKQIATLARGSFAMIAIEER
jgi:hypothetical protein